MLSGNVLKIIAAISMLIDHIGCLIFPDVKILRIVGRIAFPIFAYMIAQGCRYTKNKWRYFGMIFLMAVVFQVVYGFVSDSLYLSILVTFSLSILMIFSLQYLKEEKTPVSALLFSAVVLAVYILNKVLTIDYGFWGCMTPVFAALFYDVKKLDKNIVHTAMTALCLILLGIEYGGVQMYALMSVPLLLIYSGKRGKLKMKYFFYIFYPVHLVILQGISNIIN